MGRYLNLFAVILFSLSSAMPLSLSAQHSRRVKHLEAQRREMQRQIKETSDQLQRTDTSTKNMLKRLSLLSQQLVARRGMISTLNSEIALADSTISEMGQRVDSLELAFTDRQKHYVRSLQAMQYKDMAQESLLFILSAIDFDQGIRRALYLKEYAEWQRNEAVKLRTMSEELQQQKADVTAQRQEKAALLEMRTKEEEQLSKSKADGQQMVKSLRSQKATLLAQLNQKKRKEKLLNKKIEQQIAREIAEAQEKARREAEARRLAAQRGQTTSDSERKPATMGGYAMTQDELRLSGSFEKNKGRLPAPITGRYTIAETFGRHTHDSFSNIMVDSYGISLRGSADANARSVFDGVVTRIFVVEGFNNSIIVRHGNYLTVYSNLISVSVSTGQKVRTGDILGKIYADPDMGGATLLHFQIWKERNKLDPLKWIRR